MKKYFYPIALVILFCFHSISISQPVNGWFYLNPIPCSNTLTSIQFTNSTTGYAVGLGNVIIKTSNGGQNWVIDYDILNNTPFNWNPPLKSVFFLNENLGYATGADWSTGNHTLKTTNAGINWIYATNVTGGNAVFFVNESTGFIAGSVDDRHISKTTNGGFDWTDYYPGDYHLTSTYFINPDTGYVVGWAMEERS